VTIQDTMILIQTLVLTITMMIMIRQTRESIKSVRIGQYQEALKMIFEWRSDILDDEELAADIAADKYTELFDKYGVKKYYHTLKLFQTFEVFYILHDTKVIDHVMWIGWQNNLAGILTSHRTRGIWKDLRHLNLFHSGFMTIVDSIVSKLDDLDAESYTNKATSQSG